MNTHVLSVQEIRNVDPSSLPDGEYKGVWGGYEAKATINNIEYTFRTALGVRTIAAPCFIRIKGGEITVTIERQEK